MSKEEARILYDRIDYVLPYIKEPIVKSELEDIRYQIGCMVRKSNQQN